MNHAQAVKLAVEAMREQIKKIAVDANFHDLMGADYPHAVKASERKKELLEAIEVLRTNRTLEL